MKPEVELQDEEKSKVIKVYRRYYRGQWYESETPQPHYDIVSYYPTKVSNRLYYSTESEAQARADAYNKRLQAYKKGQQQEIPNDITWYDFSGTDVQNPLIWWHESGSWLYAHGYDDWELDHLMEDSGDVDFPYDDYDHTTIDFLNIWFTKKGYIQYEIRKDRQTDTYKIFKKD